MRERVSKILANRGLCSRREADRLIEHGQVSVDGAVIGLGAKADTEAQIEIDRRGRRHLDAKLTVLLHKPAGIVSTQPEGEQTPAWQLLTRDRVSGSIDDDALRRVCDRPWKLHVAGRLDRASRGLLVLTQDGVLAKRLTGSKQVRKRYLVTLDRRPSERELTRLRQPFELDGKSVLPMKVRPAGDRRLRFVLVEGRKHQIRRCCNAVDLTVTDLLREAIDDWTLDDLDEGRWRLV